MLQPLGLILYKKEHSLSDVLKFDAFLCLDTVVKSVF